MSRSVLVCVAAAVALCNVGAVAAAGVPQGYTIVYNQSLPTPESTFLVAEEVLITGTNPVTAIAVSTGDVMWSFRLNEAATVASLVVVPCLPDVVFVAGREPGYNGTLTSLDLASGVVHWNQSSDLQLVGGTCLSTGQPLVLMLNTYAGPNRLVTAIDAQTGAVHRQIPLAETASFFIQAGADQVVTCAGSQICATQTNSLLTGDFIWGQSTRSSDDDFFPMSYAFDSLNDGYFSEDGIVFKRDANGNTTAKVVVSTGPHAGADVIIGSAGVYLYTTDLLGLYTSDLKLVWSAHNVPYGTIVDDNHSTCVLAISESGNRTTSLQCLSVSTGVVAWSITLPMPVGDKPSGCGMSLHTATLTVSCGSFTPDVAHNSVFEVDRSSGTILNHGVFLSAAEYGLTPATLDSVSGVIPLVFKYGTYVLGVAPSH